MPPTLNMLDVGFHVGPREVHVLTLAEAPRNPVDFPILHPRDPLVVAADLLHAAARMPFRVNDALRWRTDCGSQVRHAATSLDAHCWERSDAAAALPAIKEQPRLLFGVTRQIHEHDHLREECRSLEMVAATVSDTGGAIDVMDGCLHLEAKIRDHYARLLDLVYESVNREIGGPG